MTSEEDTLNILRVPSLKRVTGGIVPGYIPTIQIMSRGLKGAGVSAKEFTKACEKVNALMNQNTHTHIIDKTEWPENEKGY